MKNDLKLRIFREVEAGNFNHASNLIDALISNAPDNGDSNIWYCKGLCHQRTGQLSQAVEAYSKCLEADPTNTKALTNTGICLLHQEEIDEAFELFHSALDVDSNIAPAWYHIGACYMDRFWKSDPQAEIRDISISKSISAFRRAVTADPGAHGWTLSMPLVGEVTVGEWISKHKDQPKVEYDSILDYWGLS